MSQQKALWECWNITDCQRQEDCPVREYEGTPCWEVARERGEYQDILQVCVDCLVFITLHGGSDTRLSDDEIAKIWKKKGVCELIPKCKTFEEQKDDD